MIFVAMFNDVYVKKVIMWEDESCPNILKNMLERDALTLPGDAMVSRLHQASHALFHRFVELRQHMEVDLREATVGDQGSVETCRCSKCSKCSNIETSLASLVIGATN